jgi:CheY-like chemotaxis protein
MTTSSRSVIHALLVNDDIADLEFYTEVMQSHCGATLAVEAYGPNEARSPHVARTLLQSLAGDTAAPGPRIRPDIIFVDYSMPDMNGLEFLRLYQASADISANARPKAPVVVMTKYESQLAACRT